MVETILDWGRIVASKERLERWLGEFPLSLLDVQPVHAEQTAADLLGCCSASALADEEEDSIFGDSNLLAGRRSPTVVKDSSISALCPTYWPARRAVRQVSKNTAPCCVESDILPTTVVVQAVD
jgi:hypothetical protein